MLIIDERNKVTLNLNYISSFYPSGKRLYFWLPDEDGEPYHTQYNSEEQAQKAWQSLNLRIKNAARLQTVAIHVPTPEELKGELP